MTRRQPQVPEGLKVEKRGGMKWCVLFLDGERELLMHDSLPSASAAKEAASRYAPLDPTRSASEFASDRRVQLVGHTVRADHDPAHLDRLREFYVKAQRRTPDQEREELRQKVRSDLRDPLDGHNPLRFGDFWRRESEEIVLGIRKTHVETMLEQLEYVERHLAHKETNHA